MPELRAIHRGQGTEPRASPSLETKSALPPSLHDDPSLRGASESSRMGATEIARTPPEGLESIPSISREHPKTAILSVELSSCRQARDREAW